MLSTPGGDGETAIRHIRQVQSRCRHLTVIVPDQAKSAGTLFALGAHRIYMGTTSDLGPVDPQFQLADGSLAAGKAIIAAVEDAELRIQMNPQTYPLHASLLAAALMVQQARDALARASAQLTEACVPERNGKDVERLAEQLHSSLIGEPRSHVTTIPAAQAAEYGLPVKQVSSDDPQWKTIWRLWTKYKALDASRIYEGEIASVVA